MSQDEKKLGKFKGFFKDNYKTIRFWLIVLLASIIALIVCSTPIKRQKGEIIGSYDINISSLVCIGCERDGAIFKPTGSDPQIHFIPPSKEINTLTITLAEEAEKDIVCQIFFVYEGAGLSESNSIKGLIKKGTSEIFFHLPQQTFSLLRLDLDGAFELDKVSLSLVDNPSTYTGISLDFGPFIVLILLIAVLASVYVMDEQGVNKLFAKIKNKLFSSDELSDELEDKRGCRLSKIYTVLALTSGLVLAIIVPPLSVADEYAHFLNVLKISHFDFLPIVKDNKVGTMLYDNEIAFLNAFNSAKPKISWGALFSYGFVSSKYTTSFFASGLVSLNPLSYIISGGGLGIIRLIFPTLDAYSCLVTARLINVIFSTVIIARAIKITPVFKNSMLLLALMPMTLYQCASVSYDSTLISVSFLFFAISMRLVLSPSTYRITKKDIVSVCVCVFFLVSTKVAYAVAIIVLLAISFKKFGSIKKYALCISLVSVISIFFYFVPSAQISDVLSQVVSTSAPAVNDVKLHQEAFYSSLNMFPTIVTNTVDFFGAGWKTQFFGALGWLSLYLPQIFGELFSVLLSLTLLIDACQIKKLPWKARVLYPLTFIIVFLGIIFEAYISWTPSFGIIGGTVAYGIQGRYFIPVVLFLAVLIANPLLRKFKYTEKINNVAEKTISISGIFLMLLTAFAIFTHYWL